MTRCSLLACCLLSSGAMAAATLSAVPATTAAEVVARNAAARGGLDAWRKVQTMVWLGHTGTAEAAGKSMPFVMQLRRPNGVRFEINGPGAQFTRVFDGTQGWKLRPGSDSRPDLKSFSPEELGYAREEFVIDGPLLDYQAKGVSVTLDGLDEIEGRKAYRLSLKLPSGAARNLWIDTKTNLDVRYDRPSSSPVQRGARVSTYYRDYATVEGLQVPRSIEVGVAKGLAPPEKPDKLLIDKVLINPQLPEQTFVRPVLPRQSGARVTITGDAPPPAAP